MESTVCNWQSEDMGTQVPLFSRYYTHSQSTATKEVPWLVVSSSLGSRAVVNWKPAASYILTVPSHRKKSKNVSALWVIFSKLNESQLRKRKCVEERWGGAGGGRAWGGGGERQGGCSRERTIDWRQVRDWRGKGLCVFPLPMPVAHNWPQAPNTFLQPSQLPGRYIYFV